MFNHFEQFNSFEVNYDPDVAAYFARMDTQPSGIFKSSFNSYIVALKNAGIYQTFDRFYVLPNVSEQASLLNIVSNISAIKNNSPIFTQYRGWKGDGISGYIDLSYNPATDAVKFKQDDSCYGIYVRQTTVESIYDLFLRVGTPAIALQSNYGTNTALGYLNDLTSAAAVYTSNTGLGTIEVKRDTSTHRQFVHNGVTLKDVTTATSYPIPSGSLYLMRKSDSPTYTTKEYCIVRFGGFLTDAQSLTMHTETEKFLDAVGAGVIP